MPCRLERLSAGRSSSAFGIGNPSPTLSWRFSGNVDDWFQAGYDVELRYQTGPPQAHHVDSEQSVCVPWPGKPLGSKDRVEVRVRAISTVGITTDWASLQVEAALLDRQDWEASVTLGPEQASEQPTRPFHLRQSFTCSEPSAARLYVTALGLYEIEINGQRIGDHCLAPGWQSYKHRLHYQIFDVGSHLLKGHNTINAIVAEGWYSGRLGFMGGQRNHFGSEIGLILQLEVDGRVVVKTGEAGWEWAYGPHISAGIYDGEHVDKTIDLSTATWAPARSSPLPNTRLIAPQAPPVRQIRELSAKSIVHSPTGKIIIDFGQNLVGWLRLNALCENSTIVLSHVEVLENGEIGTRPLRHAKATDTHRLGCSRLDTKVYFPRIPLCPGRGFGRCYPGHLYCQGHSQRYGRNRLVRVFSRAHHALP